MNRPNENLIKIRIPLVGSARDSGFESETVWAEPLGANRYRVWNLPVFAYNIDMRAIVECTSAEEDGFPVVVRVVEPGDCYVVRLYFAKDATAGDIDAVLGVLSSRQAVFEKYEHNLWAVGLRSVGDYKWIGGALKDYIDRGLLTIESGYQPNEPKLGERVN